MVHSINFIAGDPCNMGEGHKERLNSILENMAVSLQRTYIHGGKTTKKCCNTIYAMVPSNICVNGFGNSTIPSWNKIREEGLASMLDFAHKVLDDSGLLVLIATKYMSHSLLEYAASGGWECDHIVTVMCKEPIGTWKKILVIVLSK